MDQNKEQLNHLEDKIDALYAEIVKIKRYFFILMIVSVAMIVLPILLGALALPSLITTMTGVYGI
jgi:hypothetical protein